MTLQETMATLKSLGTEQNRKIYARHGAGGNVYGVSFANFGVLKKKIKVDHTLAQELWKSSNFDARILATMVADPAKATGAELDEWVKEVHGYSLADAVSKFVAGTPLARKKMEQWIRSKHEFTAQAGWQVFAQLVMQDGALPDDYVQETLAHVVEQIHNSQNRVRHAMNSAIIAIGLRGPVWRERALAAAAQIGKVTVDHGETDCQTPDAAAYILKASARTKRSK